MDSYIVTIINTDTGKTHVSAEWECGETDAELYTKAAATVSRMVQEIGSVGLVINLRLVNA